LHCLDADTGEHVWKTQLGKKIVHRSQRVADDKIYVACGRDMYVLKTGRNCTTISESRLAGEPATPEADDGIAVLSMGRYLAAYRPAELMAETELQARRGEKR
jgi:hypothetical protein